MVIKVFLHLHSYKKECGFFCFLKFNFKKQKNPHSLLYECKCEKKQLFNV